MHGESSKPAVCTRLEPTSRVRLRADHEPLVSFPYLKVLGAALSVILGVFSVPVNAQQPFKTNDAPTVEKGVRQVQFLNSFDRMDESLTPLSKQNWANLSLGLGISQQMEVGIAIPYLAVGGTAWKHGIGDLEVNAKVQMFQHRPVADGPASASPPKLSSQLEIQNSLLEADSWTGRLTEQKKSQLPGIVHCRAAGRFHSRERGTHPCRLGVLCAQHLA